MRIKIGFLTLFVLFLSIACQMPTPEIEPENLGSLKQSIIGGKPDGRHPAVGALAANRRNFCTATLIASRLVFTAAHCITSAKQQQQRGIKIQFRVDQPNGNSFTTTYLDIQDMQIHPQYGRSGRGLLNDVAVVILAKDATGVTPIPANTAPMDSKWTGRKFLYLGYGVIQTRPRRVAAPRKYGVELPIRRIQNDRFESYAQGQSICSGDSGGPSLYTVNGQLVVMGINSYVNGRSAGGQPYCDGTGTSFRSDIYAKWLQPYLSKYGGTCKADSDCGACYRCDKGKCVLKGTKPAAKLCSTCANLKDCGGNGNLCVRRNEGYRCLQACDNNGCCPLGYSCQQVGAGSRQCVPNKNVCAPVKCQNDKVCGPGELCQGGVCKPKPVQPAVTLCKKCSSDADCQGKGSCRTFPDGKYCLQACEADLFCPSGYTCQPSGSTRQCVPTSNICRCTADTDCYQGFVCQRGLCRRQGGGKYNDVCDNNRPCAQGYRCLQAQNGRRCFQSCVGGGDYPQGTPGSFCTSRRQCNGGSRCLGVSGIGYVCLQTCQSNNNCNNGGTCTRAGRISLCVCRSDADCKNGTTCNGAASGGRFGTCAKKGTSSAPKCDNGFSCRNAGGGTFLCLPEGTQGTGDACSNTKRCKSGMVCARTAVGNVCVRICRSNTTCGAAEGGRCTRSGNAAFCTCRQDSECLTGFTCNRKFGVGLCIKGERPECRSDNDCPPQKECKLQKCVDKPKPECTVDNDCQAGETCVAGKCEKKPANRCVKDGDCKAGEVCQNAKCVPAPKPDCTQDSDCGAGKECKNQKCVEPTKQRCRTEVDCPPGALCKDGFCIPEPTEPLPPTETKPQDAGPKDSGLPAPPTTGCGCATASDAPQGPLSNWLWLLLIALPLVGRRRRR